MFVAAHAVSADRVVVGVGVALRRHAIYRRRAELRCHIDIEKAWAMTMIGTHGASSSVRAGPVAYPTGERVQLEPNGATDSSSQQGSRGPRRLVRYPEQSTTIAVN